MLGKLFKQEAKTQGKTVWGMYGVLITTTLLVIALFLISRAGKRPMQGIFLFGSTVYGITVIVVFVVNFVYLCFHFYQSMYSAQGYLTHTLPVKTTQILHVKIIVSFMYLFLTGIISIFSFFLIGMVVDGTSISTMFSLLQKVVQDTAAAMGISGTMYVLFLLVALILGCLNALLLFFAGSSIGQLAHRSKGAYGIAAGIGLYYFSQMITVILLLLGAFVLFPNMPEKQIAPLTMAGSCLSLSAWAVIYYMISRVIVQKHLNLE